MTSESSPPPDRLIPSLPDDIAVRCIALVPRSSHCHLRHVSRSWRHLLASPLFLAVRSNLASTDPILLLHLHSPSGSTHSTWALLFPRAGPTYLPAPPLTVFASAAAVAVGPELYLLGGSHAGVPTAAVQILDARTTTWRRGPRMSAPREFAAGGHISGRVFAVGGCFPLADTWAETSNITSAGKWAPVPSPPEIREKWMHGSAVLNGRLFAVADRGGVVYNPVDQTWRPVSPTLDMGWKGRAAVVGGILYSYDFLGKIKGYDEDADEWKAVRGVEKELPRFLCGATLADLGGVLCVVWEGKKKGRKGRDGVVIDWAGIAVGRTEDGGLQGRILWMESVMFDRAPGGSSVAHCVALEL